MSNNSIRLPQAFIEQVFTPVSTQHRPNFFVVNEIHNALFEGLQTIPTGNTHGAADMVCRPGTNDWSSRTNNARAVAPIADPGLVPVIPNGTTQVEERAIVRQHESNRHQYLLRKEAQTLTVARLATIFHVFAEAIRHAVTGFANVQPHRFFSHMYATYGRMTDALLAENLLNLDKVWDPRTEQIEHLFNRQEKTQQIAANDDPITARALIRHTKSVLLATGCFSEDLRSWDGRIPAHQTWTHFKQFFMEAFIAFLESPAYNGGETAGQAGYNGANAAQQEGQPFVIPFGGYCFTHGWSFDPTHTSATCRSPCPNHNVNATFENMMGGCARLNRRRGEQVIFRRPQRNNDRNGTNREPGNNN